MPNKMYALVKLKYEVDKNFVMFSNKSIQKSKLRPINRLGFKTTTKQKFPLYLTSVSELNAQKFMK